MTRKKRSAITAELSRLSRNGWAHARPVDYVPLEAALRRATVQRVIKQSKRVQAPDKRVQP